jgi:hypothetical protein
MTVEQAQASSIEIDKTRSPLKQTAVGRDTQHSRFGIKTKLFLAFFSFAGLTVLASAIAWYVFRDIERAVTRVTVESVPGIVTALSSAEKSAEIAAAAPTLMAVGNQEERVLEEAKLEERVRALATQIKDLVASKVPPEKTFENRAGNYGEDPRVERGGRKAPASRSRASGCCQRALRCSC